MPTEEERQEAIDRFTARCAAAVAAAGGWDEDGSIREEDDY